MTDIDFMMLALDQARIAAVAGEVPVGAVVVRNGEVIASGCNALVGNHDPTAHAEIVALRAAAIVLGNYRLNECELFVTLEPCAMCSGAILNARLKRVIFGACEPKTGAAGSVVNLFDQIALNHQTECTGGILAETSRGLMQSFFRQRRIDQRGLSKQRHPLREDALRTPDAAFDELSEFRWKANYRNDLPALEGLRMHYLDEQMVYSGKHPKEEPVTFLCLHELPGWSYGFKTMLPSLLESGNRIVAPDLIGFGKSDKPKKPTFHTFAKHRLILIELVEALDLHKIVVVFSAHQSLLGLTLPMAASHRYSGFYSLNAEHDIIKKKYSLISGFDLWKKATYSGDKKLQIYPGKLKRTTSNPQVDPRFDTPFYEDSYRAAILALPALLPNYDDVKSLDIFCEAKKFWTPQNCS